MKLNPSTKLYLKQFLFITLLLAVVMPGVTLILENEFSLWGTILEIIFIAGIMSYTQVSHYIKEFKKKEIAITDESLSVKHSEEISSGISKEKLIKTLQNDPFFSKMKMKKTANGLKLNTGFSWTSWGEKMRISFPNSEGKMMIFSKPILPIVIMDSGRNKYNADRAAHIINDAA